MAAMILASALLAAPALAGGAVTSGQTVAGTVSGPTFLESWTFSGTAGQRIIITAVRATGAMDTNIRLRQGANADEINASSDRSEVQLAHTGTYTLDVGFPVGINDARTESLVIEERPTGLSESSPSVWNR